MKINSLNSIKKNRITSIENYLDSVIQIQLNQEQIDALVYLAFDLDLEEFKCNYVIPALINKGQLSSIPKIIMRKVKPTYSQMRTVIADQVERRIIQAQLFSGIKIQPLKEAI